MTSRASRTSCLDRHRQPDGHGVRPGRRALRPRVRRRLLRGEPRRPARPDRLRRHRREPEPAAGIGPTRPRDGAADGRSSRARARPTPTATGSATRGTSTATAGSTSTRRTRSFTYTENGVYRATLTVYDVGGKERGRHASADLDIVVGNQAPEVTLVDPVEGQPFQFGDTVSYEVRSTDDQAVDCDQVTVTYVLGHDHTATRRRRPRAAPGTIETTVPRVTTRRSDDLNAVFVAEYTDPGERRPARPDRQRRGGAASPPASRSATAEPSSRGARDHRSRAPSSWLTSQITLQSLET